MDPDPDPDPAIFVELQDAKRNLTFFNKVFLLVLFEGTYTFTSFFKDEKQKEVAEQ
jgi:hypothetical protein